MINIDGGHLAQKEFALIQEISRKPTHTQRSLSQSVGLSLGTTNLLIQRLARKGLIKVTQLDWKRTQYLLTIKGAMEKTHKAYHYTVYTIRLFRQIQDNITTLLKREYQGGRRRFYLVAQDEIMEILREAVAGLSFADAEFTYCQRFDEVPAAADLVLSATLQSAPKSTGERRCVSLVDFDNIDFRIA
ncbi:MAG: winged helix-turn-helix transcriptional regulator [Elusimicrobia bacterium]|nr:winged helix-turn-helix transcriptional regulator [Elusimicrobiota bacterium]